MTAQHCSADLAQKIQGNVTQPGSAANTQLQRTNGGEIIAKCRRIWFICLFWVFLSPSNISVLIALLSKSPPMAFQSAITEIVGMLRVMGTEDRRRNYCLHRISFPWPFKAVLYKSCSHLAMSSFSSKDFVSQWNPEGRVTSPDIDVCR